MDTLSDLLSSLRFQGALYGQLDCRAPWGLHFPHVEDHVRLFVVVRGGCLLKFADGSESLPLAAGELVLCHAGTACDIKDAEESSTVSIEVIGTSEKNANGANLLGGAGALSSLIVGCFSLSAHRKNPFWTNLPDMMHLRAENIHAAPGLETTIKLLISELANRTIGADMVINRLSDALFVQIVRAHILQVGKCPSTPVWLKGLADPQIGIALNMIHENPAAPWTVAELATAVNMSRTAFATKFMSLVGYSPIDYLNTWRMQKAIAMLQDGEDNLVAIGTSIGYGSRAAFAKAFKKEFGQAPGEFKRQLVLS